jgi:DNA polymerase III epsilon subunit-like protein
VLLPAKEFVILDLETTESLFDSSGVLPEVVEIGMLAVDAGLEPLRQYSTLIRPSNPELFTEFSENLTGLSRKDVETAPDFRSVWKEVAEFTKYNQIFVGSWGVGFDQPVLARLYTKSRLGYPHKRPMIDLLSVVFRASAEWGFKLNSFSLTSVCNRFSIDRPNHHRALADCKATLQVLQAIQDLESL